MGKKNEIQTNERLPLQRATEAAEALKSATGRVAKDDLRRAYEQDVKPSLDDGTNMAGPYHRDGGLFTPTGLKERGEGAAIYQKVEILDTSIVRDNTITGCAGEPHPDVGDIGRWPTRLGSCLHGNNLATCSICNAQFKPMPVILAAEQELHCQHDSDRQCQCIEGTDYRDINDFLEECLETMRVKGHDYREGNDDDLLHNFRTVSRDLDVPMEKVWYIYASKHWKAIKTFIKEGGQSESEPIEGRIKDVIVYLLLFYRMVQDNKPILEDAVELHKREHSLIGHSG